jgi:hypothetical protein
VGAVGPRLAWGRVLQGSGRSTLEQELDTKKDNIAAAVAESANSEAAKHEKRVEPLEQEINTEEDKTPEAEAKGAISKMATVFDPQRRVS